MRIRYNEVIKEQYNKGIIEKVSIVEVPKVSHYIPHQVVLTPGKATTKLRVVYDASAKAKSNAQSLNDCLYRGVVILEDLCGLLMRFRLHEIALVADIEKAFLQVSLSPLDRDVTRFLWLKDPTRPPDKENLECYRFCRVPFGIISSPFLLGATIQHHLSKHPSDDAKLILNNLYVDNVITGVKTPEESLPFFSEAKKLFNGAAMNLRDWASNDRNFINTIPECDRAGRKQMKVLGMLWDQEEDTLQFPKITLTSVTTKRQVMQAVSTVFDPLGLVSPTMLISKLFLQSLWKDHLSWDDELSPNQLQQWQSRASELEQISDLSIPRILVSGSEYNNCQMLCFCDASKDAYAAVVYLRVASNNVTKVSLIFAKTRLAPTKSISIPRLELLAMVIGVRAMNFVEKQLHLTINAKYIWSDSKCVLHWIRSPKPLSLFVSNRVKEIKTQVNTNFRYVNTAENPADIASRGMPYTELSKCNLWWNGPNWLLEDPTLWPDWNFDQIDQETLQTVNSESNARILFETHLLAVEFFPAPFSIQLNKYSSLKKLLKITMVCQCFIAKVRKQPPPTTTAPARLLWEKYVQSKNFKNVVPNLVKQLGLVTDSNGILKCHGRLHNAELPYEARFPTLLPKESHFTKLVVLECHENLYHAGVSHTLSQVRYSYWIPHGRATVTKILNSCLTCRRHQTGPYLMPRMPPLPKCRVSQSSPFSYTGLDYLGPLYTNDNRKIWICLFTCLAVRGVHLELVQDISAHQFLLCLRRFIAVRGKPVRIVPDNAPQFKLVNAVVHSAWNDVASDPTVTSFLSQKSIIWNYIPEFSPWMGGFYERLVSLVKRSLRKSLGKSSLTTIQLFTITKEIEAVLNTRPLVYLDDDINNATVLTPSHFLGPNTNIGSPELDEALPDFVKLSSREVLLDKWKSGQKHLNAFWEIWTQDYLLSLRERPTNKLNQTRITSKELPKINSVVLVKENAMSRNNWKLGRIIELNVSQDGEFRSAKVQTRNRKAIVRPLSLLFPIECPEIAQETNDVPSTPDEQETTAAIRPRREAATAARSRFHQLLNDGQL